MTHHSEELKNLIAGYEKFKAENFDEKKAFDELVKYGQKPKLLIIACCDSRVDPAIVMGCQPGDLFVVRNVANLVPPYKNDSLCHAASAALEYGVLSLEVTDIIIFGHSYCGGIRALMTGPNKKQPTDFIDTWMDIALPAKQRVLEQYPDYSIDEQAHHCEKESLLTSLENLKTFPWIQARVSKNKLALHAWYFDLWTGTIEAYQPETKNSFAPLISA